MKGTKRSDATAGPARVPGAFVQSIGRSEAVPSVGTACENLSPRRSHRLAVLVNPVAPGVGSGKAAAQAPIVRPHVGLGTPHDEIGIEADVDGALPIESGKPRGRMAH